MIYFKNKYFGFSIENPLKTWWKARKYFKFPKIAFNFIWKWKIRFIEEENAKKFNIKFYKLFGKCFYFSNELFDCPYARLDSIGKIIDIDVWDVSWKDKWNSPRHERDPFIYICLFGCIGFKITFYMKWINPDCEIKNVSMEYWEYILECIYYNKSLKEAISYWQCDSKTMSLMDYKNDKRIPYPIITPIALISLNKRGRKEFRRLFKIDKYK